MILASTSPRRKELLKKTGIKFKTSSPDIDERSIKKMPVKKFVKHSALMKALSVKRKHPDDVILAADTVVVLNGRIFGKPASPEHAYRMLSQLSGRTHHIYTGCAILHPSGKRSIFVEKSSLTFRKISRQEILDYIESGESADKAGAYAYQGGAKKWVMKIVGSSDNIIGLPVEKVLTILNVQEFQSTSNRLKIQRKKKSPPKGAN